MEGLTRKTRLMSTSASTFSSLQLQALQAFADQNGRQWRTKFKRALEEGLLSEFANHPDPITAATRVVIRPKPQKISLRVELRTTAALCCAPISCRI